MNPVMSDLAIFIANHEAQVALESRQRTALGTARSRSAFSALVANVVNAIRQFLDPRGYAMAQLGRREAAPRSPLATRRVELVAITTHPETVREERLAA